MTILKKLRFLENRDSIIINNVSKATKAYVGFDKDYFVEATKIDSYELRDMYILIKDVIEVGKKLYECNKSNIYKILDEYEPKSSCSSWITEEFGCSISCSIQPFKYDYLLFKRDTSITKETADIIKEWCDKSLPISFNSTKYNGEFTNKVDIHLFVDISIFTYLLFSSITNQNIKKIEDYPKRKKLEKYDNGIRFSNIVDNYIDEDHFYARIISYINFYENNMLDNSRPIFKETTRLYFEEINNSNGRKKEFKPKLKRCFENIYSFYLFVIKMGIYSAYSNFKIVNMCPCGEVIDGKSELCDTCKRMFDVERKKS